MNPLIALLLVAGFSRQILAEEEKVRYDGFQVHRVTPKTQEAVDALRYLEEHSDSYDFWNAIRGVGHPVDVMVPPHFKYRFGDVLKSGAFDSEVYVQNVQELIDNERPKNRVGTRAFGWSDYGTLAEINEWLRGLAANDSRVTLLTVGSTFENRDILGVRVSFKSGNANRSVFVESGIHAREWISSAVSTWILNELLTSTNANVRRLAERHDWYFVPVFNPDGFQYSHASDRLWRKTRTQYTLCRGADPNRNWAYNYNQGGTSNSACSETYRGPNAFSETSTRTLSEFITTIGRTLQAYISFHSYSQLILLPYGHSAAHVENYNDLYRVGVQAARSLAQRYNTEFEVGNIVEILYVASGGSMDWVKGTFGTPITYTYELRDTGRYGFVLPANQILPSALETFDSFVTIFDQFDALLAQRS